MLEYSYLVKKVNFDVEVIPPIKIISNAFIHCFFIAFIIFVNFCYGKMPTIYYLQVIYYFFCAAAFSMSIGWLCSAITPFATDVSNIVSIIIQLGFWITPIFWDPSALTDAVSYTHLDHSAEFLMKGIFAFVLQINYGKNRYENLFLPAARTGFILTKDLVNQVGREQTFNMEPETKPMSPFTRPINQFLDVINVLSLENQPSAKRRKIIDLIEHQMTSGTIEISDSPNKEIRYVTDVYKRQVGWRS